MSEIHSISPTYPVLKPVKIIREQDKDQSNNKKHDQTQQGNKDEQTGENTNQHIDEIV